MHDGIAGGGAQYGGSHGAYRRSTRRCSGIMRSSKGKMDDVFLAATGKKLTGGAANMTGLRALIRRNCKLFFKDKGMFITSLITPAVLLVLYTTFLARRLPGRIHILACLAI